MKAFWKALGIAALAALVPVRYRKDEESGRKTFQSLLISVDVGPGKDEIHTDIGISLGEGVLTDLGRKLMGAKEAGMFTDDPDEAAVDADLAQAAADEAQSIADNLQAAADEAQAAADEAAQAELDADASDFDPEF